MSRLYKSQRDGSGYMLGDGREISPAPPAFLLILASPLKLPILRSQSANHFFVANPIHCVLQFVTQPSKVHEWLPSGVVAKPPNLDHLMDEFRERNAPPFGGFPMS